MEDSLESFPPLSSLPQPSEGQAQHIVIEVANKESGKASNRMLDNSGPVALNAQAISSVHGNCFAGGSEKNHMLLFRQMNS